MQNNKLIYNKLSNTNRIHKIKNHIINDKEKNFVKNKKFIKN